MYSATIIAMTRRYDSGTRLNPKTSPSGVKGSATVTTTVNRVAINRYFAGLLLKKGFRLRMTNTISEAEMTDSRNQPVRNWSWVACRMSRSAPNVRKSNTELTRPKVIMNLRMATMSQRRGWSTISLSTVSVAMVISGKSVIKLVSRICAGNNGRYGRKSDAPAMLNMLPKLALVAMKTYFSVFANVVRPSRTP